MTRLSNGCYFPLSAPSPANVLRLDHACLPLIEQMNANGLYVDQEHFRQLGDTIAKLKGECRWKLRQAIGRDINPLSGDQVAALLFRELGLKQGHGGAPRLTPAGDRETTGQDILEGMRAQHPVVGLVLEYRELDKLEGAFCKKLPLMVSTDGRLRTRLKSTTARNGRLASENPNLQNIPIRTELGRQIRAGFIAPPGRKLVGLDLCLHPDTLVQTLTGPKPIDLLQPGDKVLTKRGDRIRYGEVTRSTTICPLPAYRLTFDNGESVVASSEHRWPIQTTPIRLGCHQQKCTSELVVGESMVPCRQGVSGGYLTWYSSKGATCYTKQHVLVAEAYHGPRPKGCHVHHMDENQQNNHPENLKYKDKGTHWSDHSRANYRKQDHTLRIINLRKGLKKRRSYVGVGNPNAKLSPKDRLEICRLAASGLLASRIAPQFGISYGHTRKVIREGQLLENHKLIGKEYVGVQPMHAITVEPDHNYVLACGVVTCNSQIEMRQAAHLSRDPNLTKVFFEGLDVHTFTAAALFEVPPEQVLPDQRYTAKHLGFAVLYLITPGGLQLRLLAEGISKTEQECDQYITGWFDLYSGVRDLVSEYFSRTRRYGLIWDEFGRHRWVPEVKSAHRSASNRGLREAANHPLSAGAQGVIKTAMYELRGLVEYFGQYPTEVCLPCLQIHDEVIFECSDPIAGDFMGMAKEAMETCVPLNVPVKSSAAAAGDWGELK